LPVAVAAFQRARKEFLSPEKMAAGSLFVKHAGLAFGAQNVPVVPTRAPGGRYGGSRILILGFGEPRPVDGAPDAALPADTDELIAYGPLLADDGRTWLETAVLLRAADADAACTVLTEFAYAQAEVHSWQFGGRPD
jgi:hypothetical protein